MIKFFGIIIGLLILSLILIIHEGGHFLVGKALGLKVVEFSIFMGPRLFSWEHKGVKYSLKLIPLGASVEFAGEYSEEEDLKEIPDEDNFFKQPVWKRALTMLAGPGANIISAILAFMLLFAIAGYSSNVINEVQANSLAADSGISAGEKITELDGYNVHTDLDINIAATLLDLENPFTIKTLDSTNNEKTYRVQPEKTTVYKLGILPTISEGKIIVYDIDPELNPEANKFVIGDQLLQIEGEELDSEKFRDQISRYGEQGTVKITVLRAGEEQDIELRLAEERVDKPLGIALQAETAKWKNLIPYTLKYQWSYVKGTAVTLGHVITGQMPARDSLMGPVGIIDSLGSVVSAENVNWVPKFISLLSMFASISLALGITNLLPITPMDGGQLLLAVIEKIRGKRLSVKVENVISIIGILIVLALFIFALTLDIGRIFG